MWHTRVALTEAQRERVLELARIRERSTSTVIRSLLDEALGIESIDLSQMQLNLEAPDWLEEFRRRHAV
ncbi:MAG: hypothetical protein OEO77_05465 [Acidimicrobiia bacterium]|nr:hypothetical protein [Acidimicrobiia bacterium]